MFCANCGTKNGDGVAFCGECGSSLAGVPDYDLAPARRTLPPGARTALVAVGAAVVLGVGAMVVLKKVHRDEPALALESYVNTLREKRYDDAMTLVTPETAAKMQEMPPEKRQMALAGSLSKMSKAYCGDGGVESFSTATVSQTPEEAQVVTSYTCTNGTKASDEANPTTLKLVDGRWLVSG